MRQPEGRFDFDRTTPVVVIRARLEEARERGGIYLIARIIQVLQQRNIHEELRSSERRHLLEAIQQAKHGKLPLKEWIPRGYQIARLLCTAQAVIPDFKPSVTKRDKRLMETALKQLRQERDKWGADQIPSLIHSAKAIGIRLK